MIWKRKMMNIIYIYTYVKISIIGIYTLNIILSNIWNFQQKVSEHLFQVVASEMGLAQASNNSHCCKGCYRLEGNKKRWNEKKKSIETYGYLWLMTIYGYVTRSHHIIRFCGRVLEMWVTSQWHQWQNTSCDQSGNSEEDVKPSEAQNEAKGIANDAVLNT